VFDGDSVDQHLSVICLPRLLITLRTSPIREFDRVLRDLDQQVPLNEGTKSPWLYAILDALTGRLVEAASNLRDEIRQMPRVMDTKPTEVKAGQIISVKRRVQDIVTVAEDQLHCVRSLIPVNTEAFPISQQRDYFRDSARNYESAMRILHRYEARASELQQQHVASLQARTESRLRILTILSSICMPLTLIAGIYGINFSQMPELQITWGYPATLTMMILIAVGQLWFSYRRGWFG
jgi:magnesium transporter